MLHTLALCDPFEFPETATDVKSRVIEALKMIPEKTANGIYQINQASASWMSDLRDAIAGKLREKSNRARDDGLDVPSLQEILK